MNKSRKRYSVTGTLDTLSTKDPSQIQSLKKLNANILNYIKNKGIKYHDITNKSFQQMTYSEIEQLYNDFKIILKLIESNNND